LANLIRSSLNLPRCPHCGIASPNLVFVFDASAQDYLGAQRIWFIYRCSRCTGSVSATAPTVNGNVTAHFPTRENPLSEDIPERPREYLSQAIASTESPVGAVMLAANAVDAMLQLKGLEDGVLNDRINEAAKINLITDEMASWAHSVRLDANQQRHAATTDSLPNATDAAKSLDFALALAEFLFVLPARVARGLDSERS
jgi:hypothetical protein